MTSLMTSLRLAAVIATVGAAALLTLPAQAHSFGSFGSFSVSFGGMGHHGHHWHDDDEDNCLSDNQVIHRIENSGFSDVDVAKDLGHDRVLVQGDRKGNTFQMVVDECHYSIHNIHQVAAASTKSDDSDDGEDDDSGDDDSDD